MRALARASARLSMCRCARARCTRATSLSRMVVKSMSQSRRIVLPRATCAATAAQGVDGAHLRRVFEQRIQQW